MNLFDFVDVTGGFGEGLLEITHRLLEYADGLIEPWAGSSSVFEFPFIFWLINLDINTGLLRESLTPLNMHR